MPSFDKLDNGTFETKGLDSKRFNKVFKEIERAQKKARRNAKRTLNRGTFTNPTSKALKALGEKAKGMQFTKADLQRFDKNRKHAAKKYDSKSAGAPYGFIVTSSRQIDIDRSNNRVDDGTGISWANFNSLKGNVVEMKVDASKVSKHQHHRVKVRIEEWDDYLATPPEDNYKKAAKAACAGRLSFDCDCGRHQYWYRYIATIGNFQIKPPAEFSFPKIRNPELAGVACKHVLRSLRMLQTPSVQNILAVQMEKQANRVGFGSDNKAVYIDKETQAKIRKANRGKTTSKAKADREYQKYQKAQTAMAKMLKKKGTNDTVKKQARKIRNQNKQLNQMRDVIKMAFNAFADGYTAQGKSKTTAIRDYAKQINVSESRLRGLLK